MRVYPGADGEFDWYADAGDTYDYGRGVYRVVPMRWDDAARTLSLGDAPGRYPGMPERVRIRPLIVGAGHGIGAGAAAASDGEDVYEGKALRITVR